MIIIGDNFFDGLQVVFGTMLVWSEVSPRDRSASRRGFVRGLSDTQLTALPAARSPGSRPCTRGGGFSGGRVQNSAPPPPPLPQPWGFKPAVEGPECPGTISARITRSRFKETYGGNFHMNDALWPFLQTTPGIICRHFPESTTVGPESG